MIAQVDPATLGLNIFYLIGLLIAGGLLTVLAVMTYTVLRVWTWRIKQRRAAAEVMSLTRRADGRLYPPSIEGICESCGRGDRKIYSPPSGELLCPACYEEFWPGAEGVERVATALQTS